MRILPLFLFSLPIFDTFVFVLKAVAVTLFTLHVISPLAPSAWGGYNRILINRLKDIVTVSARRAAFLPYSPPVILSVPCHSERSEES